MGIVTEKKFLTQEELNLWLEWEKKNSDEGDN